MQEVLVLGSNSGLVTDFLPLWSDLVIIFNWTMVKITLQRHVNNCISLNEGKQWFLNWIFALFQIRVLSSDSRLFWELRSEDFWSEFSSLALYGSLRFEQVSYRHLDRVMFSGAYDLFKYSSVEDVFGRVFSASLAYEGRGGESSSNKPCDDFPLEIRWSS